MSNIAESVMQDLAAAVKPKPATAAQVEASVIAARLKLAQATSPDDLRAAEQAIRDAVNAAGDSAEGFAALVRVLARTAGKTPREYLAQAIGLEEFARVGNAAQAEQERDPFDLVDVTPSSLESEASNDDPA